MATTLDPAARSLIRATNLRCAEKDFAICSTVLRPGRQPASRLGLPEADRPPARSPPDACVENPHGGRPGTVWDVPQHMRMTLAVSVPGVS